jgi:hypothetical protein
LSASGVITWPLLLEVRPNDFCLDRHVNFFNEFILPPMTEWGSEEAESRNPHFARDFGGDWLTRPARSAQLKSNELRSIDVRPYPHAGITGVCDRGTGYWLLMQCHPVKAPDSKRRPKCRHIATHHGRRKRREAATQ